MLRQIIAFAALPLLASCVAPREAAPVPAPAPAPAPRPVPTPAPVAVIDRYQGDWSVADLDGRDWSYGHQGYASYAILGDDLRYIARLGCDNGRLTLARAGEAPAGTAASLNIRTSFAERSVPVEIRAGSGRGGTPPMLIISLPSSDPLWDQILYSRGRFVIEATGNVPMIVPTRAELARVVEDCRG